MSRLPFERVPGMDEEFVSADGFDDLPDSTMAGLLKKFRGKRDLYIYLDTRGK